MFAVRIHGRGGQGAVTAAELLSVAAFDEGRHAQAFPTFGSERTGAPVVSFCRIDDRPIRLREPIADPDALVVQDPTLLHQVNLFAGLGPTASCCVNTSRTLDGLGLEELVAAAAARARRHRARHRDRPGAPRPAAAQRGAARRLRRAHRPGVAGSGRATRSGTASPARSARATPRAAEAAHEHVLHDPEEAGRCLARSRARRRWPAPSPCAGRR